MVRNIVFDLGEVLVTYKNPSFICEYGVPQKEAEFVIKDLLWRGDIWHGRDLGITSSEEDLSLYVKTYPEHENALRMFFEHENEWYSENRETWGLLKRLKKAGFKIYVLTNWHKESWTSCIVKMPFMQYANGAVISGYEGVRKPDAEIYKILFERYDLKPEECFFFDDKERNVDAGKMLGMDGMVVTGQEMLREKILEILEPYDWI